MRCFFLWLCLSSLLWARPLVVAHRGGTRLGAENSLVTFQRACELGVDAIELDIHQSKDGGLAVIHDADLDRTFARPGLVGDMTMAELSKAGVPSLQEAIDVIQGRCRLFVEIKHPRGSRYEGIERRLVQTLRQRGLLAQAVVISFDAASIKLLHELEPTLATGYLTGKWVDPAKTKAELGITYLAPHFSKVDPAFVESARSAGLKLGVWTVNDRHLMETLAESCDAITTDDPATLLDVVGR